MANQDFLVIKRGYDFSKWLLQHTGKFPKSYRTNVAAKLESVMFFSLNSSLLPPSLGKRRGRAGLKL